MSAGKPIRVLIVDDSALVRKTLCAALEHEAGIEVVGTASDPYIARDKILELLPDVLTLDIEMPRMDGITFLKKLMQFHPLPVIVISSLGQAACQASVDALRAGAVEILAKPNGPYSVGELGRTLGEKIRAVAVARLPKPAPAPAAAAIAPVQAAAFARNKLIVIGASTGGPAALAEVLATLPANTPPILIVQHMPAVFTKHFAERLDRECAMAVKEAEDGDAVLPGRILIAPGNFHMTLKRTSQGLQVQVGDGPQVCFSRPSVDVLFASVAQVAASDTVAAILTGMGGDGARGMLALQEGGAATIAQDEDSCVVFGMPKEAIRRGAVQMVMPLGKVAQAILHAATLPPRSV